MAHSCPQGLSGAPNFAFENIFSGCSSLSKLNIGNNDFNDVDKRFNTESLLKGIGTFNKPCSLIVGPEFDKSVLGVKHNNNSNGFYRWHGGYFTLSSENTSKNIVQEAKAPHASTYNNDNKIYAENDVDEKASFPGGWKSYQAYIDENIIHSPNIKQGNISINAVVEKDGAITNAQVEYSPDNSINNVALNLIKQMPKWTPAKRNGQAVRSQVSLFYNIKRN